MIKYTLILFLCAVTLSCSARLPDIDQEVDTAADSYQQNGDTYCSVHHQKLSERMGYCARQGITISWGEFVFDLASKYPNAIHASCSFEKSELCDAPSKLTFCNRCQMGWDRTVKESDAE